MGTLTYKSHSIAVAVANTIRLPPTQHTSVRFLVSAELAPKIAASLSECCLDCVSRLASCGICHSDVHQIDDAWQAACFPLIPGHEIVGTIVAVAGDPETRARFAVGDRACIGVQRGCCGGCALCNEHLENLCPRITKTYAGPGKDKGGFASLIRYPAAWVFKPPAEMASVHVGPLMCAGITTYSPLKRFCKPGARVGIIGIGGLGHVALQFARALDFGEVVALSRSPSKEAEARAFGASAFLLTDDAGAMAAHSGTFDLILNTVSGHAPLDAYLSLLKPRGAPSAGVADPPEQRGIAAVRQRGSAAARQRSDSSARLHLIRVGLAAVALPFAAFRACAL